jgi:hypothetical protein
VLSCACACVSTSSLLCCYDIYLLFLPLFVSLTGDFSSSSAKERQRGKCIKETNEKVKKEVSICEILADDQE